MYNQSIEIAEKLGQLREANIHKDIRLRKASRVKTIYASCAIENNTMTFDEVTAILNGKVVLGPLDDILEIQNAARAYDDFETYQPYCVKDLLKAHAHMTHHAITESGQFRTKGVGILKGNQIVHQGAPSYQVPQLIEDLFTWCQTEGFHPLIQSCIVHYEIESIHPFADGNGRMGRLWQSVILAHWHDTFRWIPVESLIYAHQQTYYDVLQQSHEIGQCNAFIEFMLDIMLQTLDELLTEWNEAGRPLRQTTEQVTEQVEVRTEQVNEQVNALLAVLGNESLSTHELMERLKLKHRPSFIHSYLTPALEGKFIERTIPDKPTSRLQKYRKCKHDG